MQVSGRAKKASYRILILQNHVGLKTLIWCGFQKRTQVNIKHRYRNLFLCPSVHGHLQPRPARHKPPLKKVGDPPTCAPIPPHSLRPLTGASLPTSGSGFGPLLKIVQKKLNGINGRSIFRDVVGEIRRVLGAFCEYFLLTRGKCLVVRVLGNCRARDIGL